MRKVPLVAFPCYRFKPEKITASGVQRATILGTKLWPCEVCPASRKTHYSLLKTEVFGSKSPWESIMQPGSNPCFPHPSPACTVILSSQLNTILNPSSLCCSFSGLKLFLLSLTTTAVDAAKSSGTSKELYSKIFTRCATAVHCLAGVEKSRMGKFHCLLSILFGHSAYNYESIKWAWDCSLAPRPTGLEYLTFTLLNSHALWTTVATGIISCRDYPWLIPVPKPHLGIRKAALVCQVKIMSRSFPLAETCPGLPQAPSSRVNFCPS